MNSLGSYDLSEKYCKGLHEVTLQDMLVSLASLYGPIGSVLAMLEDNSLELLKAVSELLNGASLELLFSISKQLVGMLDVLDVMSF